MSNYASSNTRMLDQQFRQALNNFRDAESISGEIPATIEMPTGQHTNRELEVAPKTYRDLHRQRIDGLEQAGGVLCLGNESPDQLPEIATHLSGDEPLVYAEVNPERFEKVLNSINLIRLGTECDLRILFEQCMSDLLLRASLFLGEQAETTDSIHSLVAPGLFLDLLGDNSDPSVWVKTVVRDRHHNRPPGGGNTLREPGDISAEAPYKTLLRLLDATASNAAGTRTLYEEAVQPHQVNSTEPVSIIVEATNDWQETRHCLDSIYESNLPEDVSIILTSHGNLNLSTEAFEYMQNQSHPPSIKTFDPSSDRPSREITYRETEAETLVFVNGSCRVREANWLEKLLTPLRIHPRVGMSGVENTIRTGSEPTNELTRTWIPGLPTPVSYTGEDCFAVRTSALDTTTGWLNEPYETTRWQHLDLQWQLGESNWFVVSPSEAPLVETTTQSESTIHADMREQAADYRTFVDRWGKLDRIANTARRSSTEPSEATRERTETGDAPTSNRRTA